MTGMVERPSRMSGSGQKSLPEVREALSNIREFLEGPPGCSRVVGRPSRMSGSGREALPNVRVWSGGPPGCSEVVGRPSRMSGSGRMSAKACQPLPDIWEGLPDVR